MRPPPEAMRTAGRVCCLTLALWLPTVGASPVMMAGHSARAGPGATEGALAPELGEPCAPCMACPVMPAPAAQSLRHPDGGTGRPQRPEPPELQPYRDAGWRRAGEPQSAVPVRLTYCRWLN